MKKSFKGSLVAVVALLGSAALVPACSSGDKPGTGTTAEGKTGSVGLNLITNGVELDRVDFVVSGPESRSGSINVEDGQSTISAFIGKLLAGTGYTITLTAFNDNVQVCSGTSSPFTVLVGATVGVGVGLQCGAAAPDRGSVIVEGQVVACPQITSVFIGPLQTSVGATIDVSAAASSAAVGFAWTGSPGSSFASSTAAATTYTCTTAGVNTITVTMTSGTCAPESVSTDVTCVGTGGGTGGATGTGGASGGTAGSGTGGTGTGGATAGTAGTETGGTGTGGATGGTGTGGATGGTGTGGATGGTGTGGATGGTGTGGSDPCPGCLTATCPAPLEAVATQCTGTTCDALQACFESSTCDEEDPRLCYCGTVPFTDCLSSFSATLPNGPCKAQIDAALVPALVPVNIPQLMAPFLLETTNPVGANFQLAICQTRECSVQCN